MAAIILVFGALALPYVHWTLVSGIYNLVYFVALSIIAFFAMRQGRLAAWGLLPLLVVLFSMPPLVFVQSINGEFVLVDYEIGLRTWFVEYWRNAIAIAAYNVLLLLALGWLLRAFGDSRVVSQENLTK